MYGACQLGFENPHVCFHTEPTGPASTPRANELVTVSSNTEANTAFAALAYLDAEHPAAARCAVTVGRIGRR